MRVNSALRYVDLILVFTQKPQEEGHYVYFDIK